MMVEFNDISLKIGKFCLSKINLRLDTGQFHVILGPTGSGKSVLLEIIAGLLPAQSGQLYLFGQSAADIPPEKRNLSYLPQDSTLFPHKDVFQNIAYGLQLQKLHAEKAIDEKIKRTATLLGISHLLTRNTQYLSGGERQRVALARALVLDRPLLLLDEPTSALHETMQEEFCLLLKSLQHQYGLTVVMTTHSKSNAFVVADQLHFMQNGQMLLSTPVTSIFNIPLPVAVAELMGMKNMLTIQKKEDQSHADLYWCEELRTHFHFRLPHPTSTAPLRIAVKPEDIRVVLPEKGNDNNAFPILVQRIVARENDALVVLNCSLTGFSLFMHLPIPTLRSLKIVEGQQIRCKIKCTDVRVVY